jgi:hypothetical protein
LVSLPYISISVLRFLSLRSALMIIISSVVMQYLLLVVYVSLLFVFELTWIMKSMFTFISEISC